MGLAGSILIAIALVVAAVLAGLAVLVGIAAAIEVLPSRPESGGDLIGRMIAEGRSPATEARHRGAHSSRGLRIRPYAVEVTDRPNGDVT
jgi:hypothetical protein